VSFGQNISFSDLNFADDIYLLV